MVSHEDWHIHFGRYQRAARRRRLLRQVGLPVLAALAGFSVVWGWMNWGPISFISTPEIRVWSGSSPVSYRNCAAARAAGAAKFIGVFREHRLRFYVSSAIPAAQQMRRVHREISGDVLCVINQHARVPLYG